MHLEKFVNSNWIHTVCIWLILYVALKKYTRCCCLHLQSLLEITRNDCYWYYITEHNIFIDTCESFYSNPIHQHRVHGDDNFVFILIQDSPPLQIEKISSMNKKNRRKHKRTSTENLKYENKNYISKKPHKYTVL